MRKLAPLVVALGLAALAAPALAARPPTADERAAIEKVLHAAGFTKWREIELADKGPYWTVDDAIAADSMQYDLKLAPGTLEIVERVLED
jgi:hypothetical protein